MKRIIIIICFVSFSNQLYSQLPLKTDSIIGTKQMKSLMSKSGFTLYKSNEYNEDGKLGKSLNLLYKEEITVDIYYNEFNNIESIAIRTGNDKVIEMLKKIVGFDKWTYAYTEERLFEKNDVYKLNGYNCQLVYRPKNRDDPDGKHIVYQFLNYY